MKATGIVRKIDDIGRIVIPKEIRKTMHVKDGQSFEIYTERDGSIIFKPYKIYDEIFIEKAKIIIENLLLSYTLLDYDKEILAKGGSVSSENFVAINLAESGGMTLLVNKIEAQMGHKVARILQDLN